MTQHIMKKNRALTRTVIYSIFAISFFSCIQETDLILYEGFDTNTRGWIEETSDFHSLKIDSGYYYIQSKDTSENTFLTSTTCLLKTHLMWLPNNYEIETRIKLIDSASDDVTCGVMLLGASIQYTISLKKNGEIEVLEYDYNSRIERTLISSTSNYDMDKNAITIKVAIDNKSFILLVNNYIIGGSDLNVQSWQDLRLFTSKQSKIAVDHLIIREITLESITNSEQ